MSAEGESAMPVESAGHNRANRSSGHRRPRWSAAAVGAAALATIATGCGSSSKTNSSATTTPPAPTTAATSGSSQTTATPSGSTGSGPATGSTIKIGYLGDQSGSLASTFWVG